MEGQMSKTIASRVFCLAFAIALSAPVCTAQQPSGIPSAPVPIQVRTAKKIFVSNAPGDFAPDNPFGNYGPYRPYNEFYAALKDWGHYLLVSAPEDADLILEIRYVKRATSPQLIVTVVDPKKNVPLWWLAESIQTANFASTAERNYERAMGNLVDDLKNLMAPANSPADNSKR
jgi:hypothetical protein